MFARMVVDTPDETFIRVNKRLNEAPRRFEAGIERALIPASQQRTDTTINTPRGRHKRPTDWQSEKQRRWWFAVGVKRWSGRTGTTNKWRVVHVARQGGGEIRAVNAAPGAPYVFGPRQQRMHVGTWLNRETYASAERRELRTGVLTLWQQVQRLT